MTNRLKEIRLTLGYNQQKMADKLCCNIRTYRSYEYEERSTPDEITILLNSELNINLNWYFTGQGAMFITPVTEQFEECDDNAILENFKNFYDRYTKMLADLNTTDYEVSKRTGISESRLEKIGLGDAAITMEEFIKLRSKYAFDANMLLFNKGFCKDSSTSADELSSDEIAALKKLAKKFT